MKRRGFLAMATGAAIGVPLQGQAHSGHGGSPLTAEVLSTGAEGTTITMTLQIASSADHSLELKGISSDAGNVTCAVLPLRLARSESTTLQISMSPTSGEAPGLFTLLLDLGSEGVGSVLVAPGL